MGRVRIDGKHFGINGRLRGTSRDLQRCVAPRGGNLWSKPAKAIDYDAFTLQLHTDFDGCARVLSEVVDRAPVYLLNSVDPYRLEGQKTSAFEIAEQLEWQVPDHVVVPGGNLANSSALGKGFLEMKQLGADGEGSADFRHPGGGCESAGACHKGIRRREAGAG